MILLYCYTVYNLHLKKYILLVGGPITDCLRQARPGILLMG